MAHMATDGKKFTNRPPMMQHNRSLERGKGLMERKDPLAQPGDEADMNDRPVTTHHHEDGSHTTVHESGKEVRHASAQELVDHLNKHLPEEEHEIAAGDSEPEYE